MLLTTVGCVLVGEQCPELKPFADFVLLMRIPVKVNAIPEEAERLSRSQGEQRQSAATLNNRPALKLHK